MRGKKAKAIRREVYEDNADVRDYAGVSAEHDQIVALGLRSKYQAVKKYGQEGTK